MKKAIVIMVLLLPIQAVFADDIFSFAEHGTPAQVRAALAAGGDANQKDKKGWTPLMHAAWLTMDPDVISTLLAAGARVDAADGKGQTALLLAARSNAREQVVLALLAAGAKVNAPSREGETPLMAAAAHNSNPGSPRRFFPTGRR